MHQAIMILLLTIFSLFMCIAYYTSMRKFGKIIFKLRDANESLIKSSDDDLNIANKHINNLTNELNRLCDELKVSKERIESIENKIEDDFGVSVRNIQTIVKTDFNKLDMVMMMSGVYKLVQGVKSLEDMELYVSLIKKMQGVIDKMEEQKEGDQDGV